MIIETSRLLLRPVTAEDIHAFFAIYGDPQTNLFNPRGPLPDIAAAQEKLNGWLGEWQENGYGHWAIAHNHQPDHIIGFGGLGIREGYENHRVFLGYRFATTAWGKGLATEFASAVLNIGFKKLGIPRISATVRENHLASQRVLEKIGMQKVGFEGDPVHGTGSYLYRQTGQRAVSDSSLS
ncbi:GNAT family acetyltransferase [Rahnella aquatilis CIP 78.65 = ATCC 33071]|uniref:Acetyltransferase, ribosomal protein N-acetylase n=1 Tax=Rahnella aquatilis (strain ATCC 33071 / DSM 4594 / JCM 1683 / NBRC 105701 / NCIMB 13365 / CIP 78.65) TaxID=745277 RepID=H2J1D7_RAHAC|nr:GNAT family N-acetyltransferase [Rahnella aquatilis]AEX54384.1 acetyltransferase, ribosomal protein N-acetylase [Rahnella aquatilis CIP 78.65 = ATCC 33071]KFC99723.1 GNAT family acetyltransferase [Rahnella aquatilis CIP 78.65 = ATCC 33071]